MNENNKQQPKEIIDVSGVYMTLIKTQSGKELLSCEIDGKHYRGFFNEKEIPRKDGSFFASKTVKLVPCNWKECKICNKGEDDFSMII